MKCQKRKKNAKLIPRNNFKNSDKLPYVEIMPKLRDFNFMKKKGDYNNLYQFKVSNP
jgi:hypothetical protein